MRPRIKQVKSHFENRRDVCLAHSQVIKEESGRIKPGSPFHFRELDLLSRLDSLYLDVCVLVRAGKRRCLEVNDKIVFGSRVSIYDLW